MDSDYAKNALRVETLYFANYVKWDQAHLLNSSFERKLHQLT